MNLNLVPSHSRAGLEALDALAAMSPEYSDGLTDHAPMAIEALERLDPSAIEAFVARYFPRLRRLDREPDPTLSHFSRAVAHERSAIAHDGVAAVLDARTLDTLAPGLAGAAFHGLLRVSHAARAIARESHPVLEDELARGLAYAALRAEPLPRGVRRPEHLRDLSLDEALAALDPSPDALTHRPGMITETLLARAAAHPTLAEVSERLSLGSDPLEAARGLRSAAVRLLAEGEQHPGNLFTLLHGVTAMDGVCALVPMLSGHAAEALVRGAGHALLAVRVGYIGRLGASTEPQLVESFESLRARAVRSLDDHAIKLAAALDESERAHPDARHAVVLGRWLRRIRA